MLIALVALLGSCGGGGGGGNERADGDADQAGAGGVIEVAMVDNAFAPASIRVGTDETVIFRFTNEGDDDHEAVLGDEEAQDAHADEADDGDHDHGGDDADDVPQVAVEPGGVGEVTYRFDEPGRVIIGCHVDGHYAAGMRATVVVG